MSHSSLIFVKNMLKHNTIKGLGELWIFKEWLDLVKYYVW